MLWLVAAGGAAGSVSRYLLGGALGRLSPAFPAGTLTVNVLGSLAIGVVLQWAQANPTSSGPWRALLAAGFCGGFTTFSTFSAETVTLLEQGEAGKALLYAALSVLLCAAATFAGFALTRRWLGAA